MILIWFIGMYVIFILQQIGLLIAIRTIEKLLYGIEDYKPGETLKKGLESQKEDEIERLNNIINELENWLERIESFTSIVCVKDIKEEIKELKGSDKVE